MIFLGLASNYSASAVFRHLFAHGSERDSEALRIYLAEHYGAKKSHVALYHTGRSALAVALMSTLEKGSSVVVNAFTCKAVLDAVKEAGLTPVYADIEKDTLHYSPRTLLELAKKDKNIKGFIIQNTLGIPTDYQGFQKIAKAGKLKIIEDLAHCAGVKYDDNTEVGTIGDAIALSFGKGKSVDTISGGAVVIRGEGLKSPFQPSERAGLCNRLQDRWYPFFGLMTRALYHVKIGKYFMSFLVKTHQVQRSADAKLDRHVRLEHYQAKLALRQLKSFPSSGRPPLRDFKFYKNKEKKLAEFAKKGIFLSESWYETPISPRRYYKDLDFPEKSCPNAVYAAEHIINAPNWYKEPGVKILERSKNES